MLSPALLIMTAQHGDRILLACRKTWVQADEVLSLGPHALAEGPVGAACGSSEMRLRAPSVGSMWAAVTPVSGAGGDRAQASFYQADGTGKGCGAPVHPFSSRARLPEPTSTSRVRVSRPWVRRVGLGDGAFL